MTESVKTQLEHRLRSALNPAALEVIDESHKHAGHREAGDAPQETHFHVRISGSESLRGKRRVAQHQEIYRIVGELMQNPIHALSIEIEE